MLRRPVLLIAIVALAGCASAPEQPVMPKVVQVIVPQYVAVPAPLTIACPVAEPSDRTIGTLVGIAYARKQALIRCNQQLDAIRKLGAKP